MAKEIFVTLKCLDCDKTKSFDKYEVNRGRSKDWRCRSCACKFAKPKTRTIEDKKTYQKNYYKQNKILLDKKANDWRREKRIEFIEALGGKCVHCGESDPIVLNFDHKFNDGNKDRAMGVKNAIYTISKEGINRFQLLCCNCNWRKEYQQRVFKE